MNKPYTCHNCATTFDILPDDVKNEFDVTERPYPLKIKTRCPGCYAAGFIAIDQMTYVINLETMQLVP